MASENTEEPIAIISYGCRYPGANNPEEFWDILLRGVDATSEVPKDRPYAEEIRSKHIKRGGFLKVPVDSFDAHFFNITPDKAPFLDPQQRILLEVVWECLERAGVNPESLTTGLSTGVFMGVWSNDYRDILQKSPSSFSSCEYHVAYLSFALGITAARISHFLGLKGPHISVDAGCSSSLYSVHQAVSSLRQEECSMAIAGGVNLILHPAIGKLNSLVLAPDGRCKSFDAGANGFGRAEGCGVIILKKLSDALKDGDKILGLIRGIAVNADATSATFGTPCRTAQAHTIRDALKASNLGPEHVSWVEAHGTGTEVGDTVEIYAINSIYSTEKRVKGQPLIISANKPNIGHSEAAAGMASIIKVLLAMKHGIIPPHINFKTPHPCIDLKSIPAVIPTEAQKWNPGRRIAGISTFGLGGHNCHLILEEAPVLQQPGVESPGILDRPTHLLALSAKCEGALKQMISDYCRYLEGNNNIGDIAYTANAGRSHFPHRLAVIGKSSREISKKLQENDFISGIYKFRKKTFENAENSNKIAFLFSDHKSCYDGNLTELYETHTVFRENLEKCSQLSRIPFHQMILGENDENEFHDLPISFSVQYSLYKMWESFGIRPNVVLGYGLGEFAASVASGRSSLEDTMKILVDYSKACRTLPQACYLAVHSSIANVERLMKAFLKAFPSTWLNISAINSPAEVVIVGESETINSFADFCKNDQQGCETWWINESKALHSETVADILQNIPNICQNEKLDCEFISCASNWENVLSSCVYFSEGFSQLWATGCNVFIEIGRNPTILGLAMANCPQNQTRDALWLPTLRKCDENWNTILSSLGKLYLKGVSINWEGYDEVYRRKKLDNLPTYPFQRKRFWVERF